jgi:hypothetical protein
MNARNIVTLFEVFICISPIEKRLSKDPFILAIIPRLCHRKVHKIHDWPQLEVDDDYEHKVKTHN